MLKATAVKEEPLEKTGDHHHHHRHKSLFIHEIVSFLHGLPRNRV